MPRYRYEIVERHIYEVDAPSASDIFWHIEEYEGQAELVGITSFNEPEHVVEVAKP